MYSNPLLAFFSSFASILFLFLAKKALVTFRNSVDILIKMSNVTGLAGLALFPNFGYHNSDKVDLEDQPTHA